MPAWADRTVPLPQPTNPFLRRPRPSRRRLFGLQRRAMPQIQQACRNSSSTCRNSSSTCPCSSVRSALRPPGAERIRADPLQPAAIASRNDHARMTLLDPSCQSVASVRASGTPRLPYSFDGYISCKIAHRFDSRRQVPAPRWRGSARRFDGTVSASRSTSCSRRCSRPDGRCHGHQTPRNVGLFVSALGTAAIVMGTFKHVGTIGGPAPVPADPVRNIVAGGMVLRMSVGGAFLVVSIRGSF
jgi:hypothetical protein